MIKGEQLVATVVEVKAVLAEREKTIALNQAQIKAQDDKIAQLQAQITQFNHQNALATKELNTSTTVAESRLLQQTTKVGFFSHFFYQNDGNIF